MAIDQTAKRRRGHPCSAEQQIEAVAAARLRDTPERRAELLAKLPPGQRAPYELAVIAIESRRRRRDLAMIGRVVEKPAGDA